MREIPAISLNAIVKNEEQNIRRMLDSVKHLVKEMIIVDTGSTDDTVAICKEYGAKVIEYPLDTWTGIDCINARQLGIDASTKPWILVLDADEEMSHLLDDEIRNFIHCTNHECLTLRRVNFIENGQSSRDFVERLFKRDVGYRWITTDGQDKYTYENISLSSIQKDFGKIKTSINEIYHFGWFRISHEKIQEKLKRYEGLSYPSFLV